MIEPYDNYNIFKFNIPIGISGDSYDRYLMRLHEMRASINIIGQALRLLQSYQQINDNTYNVNNHLIVPPSRMFMKTFMESMILHFKFYSEGIIIPKEEVYSIVEAPKGEFGIYLQSNDTSIPYRCRIKAPGFLHLQGLNHMACGTYLADLVTIIGTLDLVFGEIDR